MTKLHDLGPGSVLGRYELVLRLATGGMGAIWAARLKGSHGFQKVVAIKALLPELSCEPSFERMFLDEAALASRLKHPNVVHVLDLGEEEAVLYQVMEWVDGESLGALMKAAAKSGGIPVAVAARIVCQVCAGLHAAHELRGDDGAPLGLVHRDLSPENVLVTTDGLAKVVDFGVAKYRGRGLGETHVGTLRGNPNSMAPEHVLGQPVDRRADVFALGTLFYELLSGVHPFVGEGDRLTISRIASSTPAVPLRSRMPAVSPRLSQIVASALAKSPEARTRSAADMMRAIEEAVPEAGVQSADALVAECLRRVAGESVDRRAEELRAALRRLDASPPSPIGPNVGVRPASQRPKPLAPPPSKPPSVRPALPSQRPSPMAMLPPPSERPSPMAMLPPPSERPSPMAMLPPPSEFARPSAKTPPYGTPSRPPPGPMAESVAPPGVTNMSNALDVGAVEPIGGAVRSIGGSVRRLASSLRDRRLGAVAVGAVVVCGVVVVLATRGTSGDEPVSAARGSALTEAVALPMGTASAVERAASAAPVPSGDTSSATGSASTSSPKEAAGTEALPEPAAERPSAARPAPVVRGAGAPSKTPASPAKAPVARKPGKGSKEFTPTGL